MTNPAGLLAGGEAALDNLARLAAGNESLNTHPGLYQALAEGQATYQQASAINSFLVGLTALRAVQSAKSSGTYVNLSSHEKAALSAMNVDYAGVVLPHASVAAQAGTPSTPAPSDPSGNLAKVFTAGAGAVGGGDTSNGWFDSPGDFFHHLTHNTATNVIGESYNFASAGLGMAHDVTSSAISAGIHGHNPIEAGLGTAEADMAQNYGEAGRAGYDPTSPLSMVAYGSKGYAHLDTSDLAAGWDKNNPNLFGWDGAEAVAQAEDYARDPKAYIKNVVNDKTLTVEQKNDLLNNTAFTDLVARVQGRSASVGNSVAHQSGIDPVKHPDAYRYTATGVDIAVSFAIDPTLLALKGVQAIKFTQIGLDAAAGGEDIRRVMTSGGMFAKRVQRGWQSMLDDAGKIRAGLESGTDAGKVEAAAAWAHARTTTPTIVDMMPDLLGDRVDIATNTVTHGAPITSMEELTNYLASKAHFLRLTRGKAALESQLMPGATSRFGYHWLRGALAARATGRSVELNLAREANIERLLPNPLDAVDGVTGLPKVVQNVPEGAVGDFRAGAGPVNEAGVSTGTALENATKDKALGAGAVNPADAIPEVTGAASAQRALSTAAQRGELLRLSRTGWSPAAQWARWKLAAQRMTSLLPRNNQIILGDADAAEKIYRFGRTFLNRGDAALYAAMMAHGDEGVQKAIIDGIVTQTGHAAGLGTTEAGRLMLEELPNLNKQAYGHLGTEKIIDPATGMERDVATFPQMVQEAWTLPNFQALYRASAKLGVWQHTVGRVFNSQTADVFLDYERMAFLLKPNIAWRNIIEGQGNIALRGNYIKLLRAKALAKDVLTPRKKLLQKAITTTALDRVGRLFQGALKRTADPEWTAKVKEFTEGEFADEFQPTVLGFGRQIVGAGHDPFAMEETDHIARQGLSAVRYRRSGFGMADASHVLGADRYAHALAIRLGKFPDLDRAVLDAAEADNGDVSGIIAALKQPGVKKLVDRMVRANVYVDEKGVSRFASTEAEKASALESTARVMVGDMKYLLTDQEGNYIKKLADKISEDGHAPDGKWIQAELTDSLRPKAVLAPTYQAVPRNGALGFVQQILDSTGRAYKYLVEDTIKRTTTEPAFLMNYGDARMALRGVEADAREQLLKPSQERLAKMRASMTPDEYQQAVALAESHATRAAARVVHDAAIKRAYNATEAMIDDPGLKTQADVVGRNFLMFSRAVNAFVRRWGGIAIENPAALRRGFLAVEGLHHSGLLYTDSYGNVNFTYPGSDLAVQAFSRLSSLIPGVGPALTYPVSGALSGQFNMLAPGFDNPARFSLSPMLNVPFHLVETMFPDRRAVFDEIDRAVNGQYATGKPWYYELVPGAINKITANTDESRDSVFAGAMRSAIMYLYAADPHGDKGIFPGADASPEQIDEFLSRLRTQVKNQLYFRAAFGEFAPAPPGLPAETIAGSGLNPDGLFTQAGFANLDDEYKELLTDTNGDRAEATAIFVERHPNRLVFTTPTSHATASGAYLPTTPKAGEWINNNLSFIDKYKSISAYFVPQDNGPFDLNSYHAQLETGLREHYAPKEFLTQARVTEAEGTFYDALDKMNAAKDKALAGVDTKLATSIKNNFELWKQGFLTANPLFAAKEANAEVSKQQSRDAIATLGHFADDANLPSNVRAIVPQIDQMIQAYHAHSQWLSEHTTTNPYAYLSDKIGEAKDYADYLQKIVGKNPALRSIYNGVFRTAEEYELPYLNGG